MRPCAKDLPTAGQSVSLRQWTFAFRAIFVLFIVWASAATILDAPEHGGHAGHSPHALLLLASAEILGALLFLLSATQLFGLAMLLLVFAVAAIESALGGEIPLRFVYFAATALFIHAVDRRIKVEATADAH